jgi:lysophospholipase L1-like esterase
MLRSFFLFLATGFAAFAQNPAAAPDLPSNPASTATRIDPSLRTLFIAGDSTAARGRGEAQQGWGVPFADYFDRAKVNVVNRARGGRSSRTFINEGLWEQLLADVKAGDLVLIQFGHNDGGAINTSPARGSIPGIGEETQSIESITTKQPETVRTFGWYMRKMIADVKAKGASPIVLSLTVRNRWTDGKIERGSGRYSQWSSEIAKAAAVPFIDLTNLVADEFEKLGEDKVKLLYPRDHTHFNAEGANIHARMVVAGLKGLQPSPVTKLLSTKGGELAADRSLR